MHGMHARLPKNFVLEERLERYAPVIEPQPRTYAGSWTQACHPLGSHGTQAFRRLHVDLGCGKGSYVVQAASAQPETLYLAIDAEPICIAYTAQHVMEAGLANVVVIPALGEHITAILGPGEADSITLNFPTPFPRKKDADKRLTILERLLDYRQLLRAGGTLTLKTDSYPLMQFSRTQFELAGFRPLCDTDDARRLFPDDPMTEYEERLSAQGAGVYALVATPGTTPLPEHIEQTASLSLVDYLPEDLETMGYVPHGMQGSVTNLRNRRSRARARERDGR